MKKNIYKILMFLTATTVFSGCWLLDFNARLASDLIPGLEHNNEVLFTEAKSLFMEKRNTYSGAEWVKGPCLGWLNDEWVVDISHSPRQPIDDDINNQCQQYYNGEAKHFIEISPEGEILNYK
ncbi:MAG: hypothetical protein WC570_01080 [Patescibacteria group bacterium]